MRTPSALVRSTVLAAILLALLWTPFAAAAPDPTELPWMPPGSSAGNLDLAMATGEVRYAYPFNLPEGPRGIKPPIALSYSSRDTGEQFAGVGWQLLVPTVVRIGDTGGAPRFDASDRFMVTGLPEISGRLMPVGTPIAGTQAYHTERESFARIIWDNPYIWTVTDRSGTRYVFGGYDPSKTCARWIHNTAVWYLDFIEDSFGNRITYALSGSCLDPYGALARPTRIAWGTYQLDFGYEPVPARYKTIGGFSLRLDQRLASLTLSAASGGGRAPVRAYDLAYTTLPKSGRSFLERISERDPITGRTLPPTVFSTGPPPAAPAAAVSFSGSAGLFMGRTIGSAVWAAQTDGLRDMNGDGLLDHVHTVGTGTICDNGCVPDNRITVRLNTGSGFGAPERWPQTWWEVTDIEPHPGTGRTAILADLIDFDGDGDADRVSCSTGTGNWIIEFNDGIKAFGPAKTWANGGCANRMLYANDLVGLGLRDSTPDGETERAGMLDMNGDGWLDFLDCASDTSCKLYLNDGSSGFRGPVTMLGSHDVLKARVAGTYSGGGHAVEVLGRFMDMNGDGLLDWLEVASPQWTVSLGRGDGTFGEAVSWPGTETLTRLEYRSEQWGMCVVMGLLDVNADGLPDLSRGTEVYYNTGSGFAPPDTQPPQTGYVSCQTSNYDYNYLDLDGDGIGELVSDNGVDDWFIGGAGRYPFAHLLRSITQPLGGITEISYRSSGPASGRLPGMTSLPATMTTRADSYWNPTEAHVRSYTFSGARTVRTRRDITWGFAHASVHDQTSAAVTQDSFTQGYAPNADDPPSNFGQLFNRSVFDDTGRARSRESVTFVLDATPPYFTPPLSRDVYSYDYRALRSTARVAHTVYAYDAYGNITAERDFGDSAITGDERQILRTIVPNIDRWIVNLPASEQVFDAVVSSAAPRRTTLFYYDGQTAYDLPPVKGFLSRKNTGLGTDTITTRFNHDAGGAYVEDPFGRVTSVTDPRGYRSITTYATDQPTFVLAETNARGQVTRYAYYGVGGEPLSGGFFGSLEWVQDPNGKAAANPADYRTRFEYDGFGRLKKLIRPYDTWTEIYDYTLKTANPAVYRTVQAPSTTSATRTSYHYVDGFGRTILTATMGESGWIFTKTLFDSAGNIAAQSAPSLWPIPDTRLTRFEHDSLGRVTKIDRPGVTGRRVRTISYEGWDRIETDERGYATTQSKDAYGQVIRVVDALQGVTTYDYDVFGDTFLVTDAKGNTIQTIYDALGRKRFLIDPDLGTYQFIPDANGNVTRVNTPRGSLNYGYDALNRLVWKDADGLPGPEVTYTYDDPAVSGIGHLTGVNGPAGVSLVYGYDRRGRKIDERRDSAGAPAGGFESTWTYDSADRVSARTFPAGLSESLTYSISGKVESVAGIILNVDYSPAGQMTRIEYANGAVSTLRYDPESDLPTSMVTIAGGTTLQNVNFTFDQGGNLTRQVEAVTAKSSDFTYDAVDRVLSETRSWTSPYPLRRPSTTTTWQYAYDLIGNVTLKDGRQQRYDSGTSPTTGLWLGGPHAISSADLIGEFNYDATGNMVAGNGRTLWWTLENRPSLINDRIHHTITAFTYDGLGHRYYEQESTTGTEIWYGADDWQRRHVGATVEDSASISVNGLRVAVVTNGVPRYYHSDLRGSTSLVTDQTGAVLERITYGSFGELLVDTSPGTSGFKYTGQEYDAATGLHNFRARLYDPIIGRFISADTRLPDLYNPQGLNRYSYALNNPLRYVDPSGHSWYDRFTDSDWWLGGIEGAWNGFSICGPACAVAGFAIGGELNYRANQPGAAAGWKAANFVFQVGVNAAAGYVGGTYTIAGAQTGWSAAGVAGVRRALYSDVAMDFYDRVDRTHTLGTGVHLALAVDAVVGGVVAAMDASARYEQEFSDAQAYWTLPGNMAKDPSGTFIAWLQAGFMDDQQLRDLNANYYLYKYGGQYLTHEIAAVVRTCEEYCPW